ncbi:hypothetical protein [uncultured Clostridium sp.]|nr:hypothetical protein [uncultured Clostridium sp.]
MGEYRKMQEPERVWRSLSLKERFLRDCGGRRLQGKKNILLTF